MNKILSIILAVCLMVCCLPALAETTVTDMTGRTVTINGEVNRIVALTASDVEIIYALGAGDMLVGRGEYCDYPAEALEVASVQSGYETNIEQILELQPQIVIMATMAQTEEQVQQLENAGITVVVSDAQNIAGVYEAITLIGAVTGKNDEAAALCKQMQDTFAAYTAEPTGKSVYFEISPLQWGLWTGGTGTFMDELASMVGLTNAFSDVTGWASISEEQVLERNPDFIITTSGYYGEGPLPTEEIMQREGWADVAAVVNGNVYNANNDEITRPGPRLMNAIEWLYNLVNNSAAEVPAA